MTRNKRKRKRSKSSNPNQVNKTPSPGLMALYPKVFFLLGLFLIVLAVLLLAFYSQDNALFGLAMLTFVTGVAISFYAKFPIGKNKTN